MLYKKAQDDKTIRTDISERSILYNIMYTMMSALSKYSTNIIHSADQDRNYEKEICQLKDMYLEYKEMSELVADGTIYMFDSGAHPAIVSNAEQFSSIVLKFI